MPTLNPKEDDEAWLARAKARHNQDQDDGVTPEMYLLAELGYYYGWEAVRDVRQNKVDLEFVHQMVAAGRKVWYSKVVDTAHGSMVATSAPHAKNAKSAFLKGMSSFINKMKIRT